jgi:hypothetical protein
MILELESLRKQRQNPHAPPICRSAPTFSTGKQWLAVFVGICSTVVALAASEPLYKSCLEYIQNTGKLYGICEVTIREDGKITLVDAKYAGYGLNFMLFSAENNVVNQVTLSPVQFCTLSDAHHVFLKYEIKSIKDGILQIVVTERFDARSFGKQITEKTQTVSIKPYTQQHSQTEHK